MTDFTMFDETNPESFTVLSLRERRELNEESRKVYDAEVGKFHTWEKKMWKERMQSQRDFAAEMEDAKTGMRNSRWLMAARKEADMLHELGKALKKENIGVRYENGARGCKDVHWSWATRITVIRNEQEVGTVVIWESPSSFYRKAIGYIVNTNRGKGSRPDSWSSDKRVKKVESAVQYILETAIPEADWEDKLREARGESTRKLITIRNLETKRNRLLRGQNPDWARDDDGLMRSLIALMQAGAEDSALRALRDRVQEVEDITDEIAMKKVERQEYKERVLEPLEKMAAEAMPEVYS